MAEVDWENIMAVLDNAQVAMENGDMDTVVTLCQDLPDMPYSVVGNAEMPDTNAVLLATGKHVYWNTIVLELMAIEQGLDEYIQLLAELSKNEIESVEMLMDVFKEDPQHYIRSLMASPNLTMDEEDVPIETVRFFFLNQASRLQIRLSLMDKLGMENEEERAILDARIENMLQGHGIFLEQLREAWLARQTQ